MVVEEEEKKRTVGGDITLKRIKAGRREKREAGKE